MAQTYRARIESSNGHQIIVLPPEVHLEGDEISIQQDTATGQVIIIPGSPHPHWQAVFAEMDAHPVPEADLDEYLVERPLNRPIVDRHLFEDER